jgi:hypothetical protein
MKKAEVNTPTLSACNGKDTHFQTELQIFFEYLQDHVATSSMVCEATGIKQKCATYYKRDLEKTNRLWEVDNRRCDITGFNAAWLTTDPGQIPLLDNIQLNLFEGGES